MKPIKVRSVCRHDFTATQRAVLWLFARPLNRFMGRLLWRARDAGYIDSRALHWLLAFFDPTQRNPEIGWPTRQPQRPGAT